MPTRRSLDILLGEALEDLHAAAGVAKNIPEFDAKPALRAIANATTSIWGFRDSLYAAEPTLKPGFVELHETDPALCERLFEILDEAQRAEDRSDVSGARNLYDKLMNAAPTLGFFRTHAEAGLYRTRQ